ncbi:MAG: universal stress protein [Adhaeribacter sp.]
MKKILVGTDYSRQARHALLVAMDIARRAHADIILFHAFNQPIPVSEAYRLEAAIADLEKEKTRILEDYVREVKWDVTKDFSLSFLSTSEAQAEGIEADMLTKSGFHALVSSQEAEKAALKIICVSRFGLPAETLLAAAEAYQADLLVMGTRGAGPVSQAFLGSTVADMIQAGKVPVLALPLQAELRNQAAFVFALDLAAIPDQAMMGWLHDWVKLFQAHLKVLHVYSGNDPEQEQQKAVEALDMLDREMRDLSYEVYFQEREIVSQGVQEFIQAHHAELLMLVPRHHTFLEILLQRTLTGLLESQGLMPLLAMPYGADRQAIAK